MDYDNGYLWLHAMYKNSEQLDLGLAGLIPLLNFDNGILMELLSTKVPHNSGETREKGTFQMILLDPFIS